MPAQPAEPIAYVPLESAVPAIYVENFVDWPATPSGPSLQPEDVARAVLYAVGQPAHVDVNEVLLRPAGQQI